MSHIEPVAYIETWQLSTSLFVRQDLFNAVTLRQETPGSPHAATRSIFLMGPKFDDPPDVSLWFQDVPQFKYPILAEWPVAEAMLEEVIRVVNGHTWGKAMIVELAPGGAVAWHVDEGAYAEAHDRYHLPLVTNPFAYLYSGGEQIHASPGVLVKFDTRVLHSAANFGQSPRIHLIVDVRKP